MDMSDRKEDLIKTYISTFNINISRSEIDSISVEFQSDNKAVSSCQTHSSVALSQSKDVTSSHREACQNSQGTYFQLVTNHKNETISQEDGSAFQKGRAYFEGLTDKDWDSIFSDELQTRDTEFSQSSIYESSQTSTSMIEKTSSTSVVEVEKTCSFSSESAERSSAHTCTETARSNLYEENSLSESSTAEWSEMPPDLQVTSQLTTTKESTTTSIVTQTTTQENITTTESRGETSYNPSTDRYGETDWYMDILLRMQALDMKQQKLIVHYDFLGKLANDNREGLKQARDWGRYESDMGEIEVY